MSTNAVVIAISALSLGATCYLIASIPKGDADRVAELERKVEAAEKRADAVESLRGEVREMRDRIDRRVADLGERVAASRSVPAVAAARISSAADPSAAPDAADAKPLDELVADRIEKKMSEKLEALASRDRDRDAEGKWKAPIDELAKELSLTDVQKTEVKRIFDRSHDDGFALLRTMRLDGGSLLDDFAAALKGGSDPGEATKQFFNRIFTEKVPGSDQTFLTEFMAMEEDVKDQLSRQLDKDQLKRLKALRVAILEVDTGHDPVGDYIRAKLQ